MMDNERITVGIACFNAQDTILRAVKSAVAQSWDNKEILIVDDQSTDSSVDVISGFIGQMRDVNIRLIRHKDNTGPAGVRQTVLDQACGEFIAFFDDDDESLPHRLQTQYAHIRNYEQATGEALIACYASGRRIYPNGYKMAMAAIGSRPEIPHGRAVADRLLFFGGNPAFFYGSGTPACSLMARQSTFEAVEGFDPAFRRVEDVDFAVRLALKGGHFTGTPAPLFIQYATQAADKAPEKNRDAEIQLARETSGVFAVSGTLCLCKEMAAAALLSFQRTLRTHALGFVTTLHSLSVKNVIAFLDNRAAPFFT